MPDRHMQNTKKYQNNDFQKLNLWIAVSHSSIHAARWIMMHFLSHEFHPKNDYCTIPCSRGDHIQGEVKTILHSALSPSSLISDKGNWAESPCISHFIMGWLTP